MEINLQALVSPELETGVPGGDLLLTFSEAVIGNDREKLDDTRTALAENLGPAAVSAAASIAANFSKNDRIANGCGIPVDPMVMEATIEIRDQLGLNNFRSAINTFRHIKS